MRDDHVASTLSEEELEAIRDSVRALCQDFPGEYWRKLDEKRAYPTAFVTAMTEAGFMAALIPEEYGGSGLGLKAACAILEEIHKSGCNAGACHAQMYTMGTVLKHGSPEQKADWLPKVASGEISLQALASPNPRLAPTPYRCKQLP